MDKRVIAAMGLLAILFAVLLAFMTRPTTEPVELAPIERPRVAKSVPDRSAPTAKMGANAIAPLQRQYPQRLRDGATPRPPGPPQYQRHAPGTAAPNPEREEARREYRCRTLQEQSDLMDRLIVVGSGNTLQPEQRMKMVSRVATLGTRVYEEDENIRSGSLECGDGAATDMSRASEFLARFRDDLADLLSDQDQEEIEQALALFEGRLDAAMAPR